MPPLHSDLPIIRLDQPPRTQRQKYGGIFYLGIGGLVVLAVLLGWFGYALWTLRDAGWNIFILHDTRRANVERINAAYALAHDRRMIQDQYWDMCLHKTIPGLARYLLAEALTREAMVNDPKGYADAVAYSEGWPDWLRLLLIRPLAYGAESGIELPHKPLEQLSQRSDRTIVLWACYTRAASWNDAGAEQVLKQEAGGDGPNRELAELLLAALRSRDSARFTHLDRATRWLRSHHPEAALLWQGWKETEGRLVQEADTEASQ
jgi:hypothetical protein